jgi:hypothetical protein
MENNILFSVELLTAVIERLYKGNSPQYISSLVSSFLKSNNKELYFKALLNQIKSN